MVFQEKTYSVLIVSASDSFTNSVMPLLPMTDYWPVSTVGSVGQARRRLTDTEFDIVLINTPLPDDFGMQLAITQRRAKLADNVRALIAVDHAISRVQATDEPFARNFDTSALVRVQSYLHFIRTSLLDPQSPLAAYAQPQGLEHAS